MKKSHQDIKQIIMEESALREVSQTVTTFQSLEAALDYIIERHLAQLETKHHHLHFLSESIDSSAFKEQLLSFNDNHLTARRDELSRLMQLSRDSTINALQALKELEAVHQKKEKGKSYGTAETKYEDDSN